MISMECDRITYPRSGCLNDYLSEWSNALVGTVDSRYEKTDTCGQQESQQVNGKFREH